MDNMEKIFEKLNKQFNSSLTLSEDGKAIYAGCENIVDVLKALKKDYKYEMLADLTSVEYSDRFEMVYHVMSLENAGLLRIKVKLDKASPVVPTITSVWKAADVQEREVYDLMGIRFEGHPNLKRILCPENFEGHPLRKDFILDRAERI